ncbi:MAG: hypothetical protein JXJ22_02425 [Bacteroidales bacterium]|nr:hypothetical protein [Bacteroidales bacterium]
MNPKNTIEESFNENESIKLIYTMIESAKNEYKEKGTIFLIWGWLVLTASALEYILINFIKYNNHWIGWPILMGLGVVLTIIYALRMSEQRRIRTYINTFMAYFWTGIGVLLFIVLGNLIFKNHDIAFPVVIAIYGLGAFTTGGLLKIKSLIIGGILCWIIALVSFHLSYSNQLIAIGLSVIAADLIPGYILNKRN